MNKSVKKILFIFCLLLALSVAANFAVAAELDTGLSYANVTGLGAQDPRVIAANIIRIALGFLGMVAMGLIIYAGWLWMSAAGEEEKVEKAKKILTGAVIGLALCLGSFAIASFILSRLTAATTGGGDGSVCDPACAAGQYCCSSACSSSPCGGIGGAGSYAFSIASTRPTDQASGVVRNVVIKAFFNAALGDKVDQTALDNNFKVEKIASLDPATGAETALATPQLIIGEKEIIDGRLVISFKDTDNCGDGQGTLNCLPGWSKFKVTINGYSGIVSVNNQSLTCSAGSACEFVFSTGDLLDISPPTAGLAPAQICKDDGSLKADANTVIGWGRDDVGISALSFKEKKDGQTDETQVYLAPGNSQTYQSVSYKYDTANFSVGDKYIFSFYAYDLANHQASASFSATIKPGHCCNGKKDASETEVDCGGDCLACVGGACHKAEPNQCGAGDSNCDDNLCSTWFCDCKSANGCRCATKPIIFNVSPYGGFCSGDKNKFCTTDADCGASGSCNTDTPNGASGNFITISGRYFGASAGKVYFSDNKQANLASSVNGNCVSSWQDNQIIAVRPAGAVDGPVKVADASNNSDATNDDRGPQIKNFLVNNIKRPGVCLANPDSGFYNDQFNLQGYGFDGSPRAVLFGNAASSVAAGNVSGWTNTSVQAAVPNIKPGLNSVFVKVNQAPSNDLLFTVADDSFRNPAIEYIEPTAGPSGQYITIYGHNFKTYNAQKSSVKFYWPADPNNLINADIDFPAACKNDWWHDQYIVVKVPKVNSLGEYKVVVTNAEGKTSSAADFTINNETPRPGLCTLDPDNGPVSQPVSAYGERFGAARGNGQISYYNNKDGSVRSWTDQKIDSNVPNGAVTGPVKVISGQGVVSNSLPFKVGKCSANAECGSGQECCGAGTNWSGVCRAQGSCARGSAVSCEFGWNFETSAKQAGDLCYSGGNAQTCDITESQCGTNLVCDTTSCVCKKPCNSNTAGNAQCLADNNKCGYNSNAPTCNPTTCLCECTSNEQCPTGQTCNPNSRTCGNDNAESCAGYGNQCYESYFCPNSPGKCSTTPAGAEKTGVKCGDEACAALGRCLDEDKNNLCSYNSTLDKCVKNQSNCSLDKTAEQSGVIDINGNKVGLNCGTVDGKAVWYYDSRQSCSTGYKKSTDGSKCTGQACAVCPASFSCTSENGAGVCAADKRICSAGATCDLASKECLSAKPASCDCCCDKTKNTASGNPECCPGLTCDNSCGTGGNFGLCSGCTVKDDNGNVNQGAANAKCNCTGTSGKYCNTAAGGGLGTCQDCASISSASECNDKGAGSCCVDAQHNACRRGSGQYSLGKPDYAYCAYYVCDGKKCADKAVASSTAMVYGTAADCAEKCSSQTQPDSECVKQDGSAQKQVCDNSICAQLSCLKGTNNANDIACGTCCCNSDDQCKAINSNLSCFKNKGTCSGDNRGLCCGCSTDADCGSNTDAVGCGTDTCCKTRPVVESESAKPTGDNVCRNSLIQATFNQPMQLNSFSGNIIVAGDYGTGQCPAGTQYLTAAYSPSWLEKIKSWLAKLPLINKLLAGPVQADDLTGNFCAVPGTVSGRLIDGGKKTILEFSSQQVLGANRTYYVIIKADTNLVDNIKEGVISSSGVTMKPEGSKTFNGVAYQGKIWSFTTKNSSADGSGICQVNSVSLSPASYLFNTSVNNPDDDNDAAKDASLKDSDKIFYATAYAADKQPINPLEGTYNWKWDWSIDDQAVAKFKNDIVLNNSSKQTLIAQNVKEANTLVHAKTTITQDTISKSPTIGAVKENSAMVYVFLCANPWPAFSADGTWSPWQDAGGNCALGGSCSNTNFEVYYCRDAGGEGAADDLPAILSDTAVIRGADSSQNIIKEFYFFREGLPAAAGGLNASVEPTGGAIKLSWSKIDGAAGYKIYYGTASGKYDKSVDVKGNYLSEYAVTGLENGKTYYFALTSYDAKAVESTYSAEISAKPADSQGPAAPEITKLEANGNKVEVAWKDKSQGDAKSFKLFYGANSNFGASMNLDYSSSAATTIGNLASGVTYYFGLVAYDVYNNPSATTTTSIALP